MKKIISISILLLFAAGGYAFADDQCYTCHEALGDKPTTLFKNDIHFQRGISCSACHGGNAKTDDMEKAMSKSAGFLGVPKGDDISKACAKCHSDASKMKGYRSTLPTGQMEFLQSSVHGKMAVSGKERIVQCITCHNAHGITSTKNPASPVYALNAVKTCSKCHSDAAFMKMYNPSLPVDQYEKYKTSVHGALNVKGDSKAAECASCHGSHAILPAKDAKSLVYAENLPATCGKCHGDAEYMKKYNIPTDQYAKYSKSIHGVALLEKHDQAAPSCNDCHGNHGATPPGVESISKVCGTCHALNAELFSSSPHKKAFDERKLPECETCHGKHEIIAATNQLLGIDSKAVCSKCHSESNNPKGYATAKGMKTSIDHLETMEKQARVLIAEAEQKGMEVGEATFKLRDARQARLESRTMVHAFNGDKFREVIDRGLATTTAVIAEAKGAVDEYYFRRIGLGFATLIITAVAISLFIFIKRIEKKSR